MTKLFSYGAVALVLILLIYIFTQYKQLKKLRQTVIDSDRKLDEITHKRFELLPDLLTKAKFTMTNHKELIDAIKRNRVGIIGAISDLEKLQAESSLSENLKEYFAVVKGYENDDLNNIAKQLQEIEASLLQTKAQYNQTVSHYNKKVTSFPSSVVATIFNFYTKEEFK